MPAPDPAAWPLPLDVPWKDAFRDLIAGLRTMPLTDDQVVLFGRHAGRLAVTRTDDLLAQLDLTPAQRARADALRAEQTRWIFAGRHDT